MLKNFFIIHHSGICIFEQKIDSQIEINPQLLSGLVVALMQFSESALMDNMQTLHLQNGQLVITSIENFDFYAIGIYARGDHQIAATRMNKKLLQEFARTHPDLKEKPTTEIVTNFDVKEWITKQKIPVAWNSSLKMNLFWSLLITFIGFGIVYLIPSIYLIWHNAAKQGAITNQLYLYIIFIIYIPTLINGILCAKWWRGALFPMIYITIILGFFYYLDLNSGVTPFISMYDVLYGVVMLIGLMGGLLGQILFLEK